MAFYGYVEPFVCFTLMFFLVLLLASGNFKFLCLQVIIPLSLKLTYRSFPIMR